MSSLPSLISYRVMSDISCWWTSEKKFSCQDLSSFLVLFSQICFTERVFILVFPLLCSQRPGLFCKKHLHLKYMNNPYYLQKSPLPSFIYLTNTWGEAYYVPDIVPGTMKNSQQEILGFYPSWIWQCSASVVGWIIGSSNLHSLFPHPFSPFYYP